MKKSLTIFAFSFTDEIGTEIERFTSKERADERQKEIGKAKGVSVSEVNKVEIEITGDDSIVWYISDLISQ